MLNRKYRTERNDIEETIKTGASVHGNLLFAKISKKEPLKTTFAIIVSKKNEKTSVRRHYLKRKISGYIEKYLKKIDKLDKKTVIFLLKKKDERFAYKNLGDDVDFIIKKIFF